MYIAPSGSPLAVAVTTLNAQSASVSWDPPSAHQVNGLVQYYTVSLQEVETSLYYNLQTNNLSLTLSDLHPYYTYSIMVAAVTVAKGPYSSHITFRAPQDGKVACT